MPVEAGDRYLVRDKSMLKAFAFALDSNDDLIGPIGTAEQLQQLSIDESNNVLTPAIIAGISYLANRAPDDYLQEVGTIAWWATDQGFVRKFTSDNMRKTALKLNYPKAYANQLIKVNDVAFIVNSVAGPQISQESAHLFVHPEFLLIIKN